MRVSSVVCCEVLVNDSDLDMDESSKAMTNSTSLTEFRSDLGVSHNNGRADVCTVQGTTQTEELEDFFGLRGIQNGKGGILFECNVQELDKAFRSLSTIFGQGESNSCRTGLRRCGC